MKKTLKLIPAIVMLLVSAILVSTSTYAWFSMNNKVTVTGMRVETKVSSNLLIAPDTTGATAKKDDVEFTDSLSQTVVGILEPVSTANALNFFYTTDAAANGQKIGSSAYIAYVSGAVPSDATAYTDKFSEDYGVTKSSAGSDYAFKAVPYVDYIFQLKATNSKETDQVINLTKLDLSYGGTSDDTTAHRIAVFVQDITDGALSSADPTEKKGIYTVASSANWDGKVINGTTTSSTVAAEYVDDAITLAEVESGKTQWFKVVVRMWLEGQDTTCNNETFLELTDDWSLDIELTLDDSTAGVKNINKV